MMMPGNLGNSFRPNFPGSSPNSTGTNPQAVSSPSSFFSGAFQPPQQNSGGIAGAIGASQPVQSMASALHPSGLPTQPPGGVNPQLWSSVLQHLNQTNFSHPAQQGRPQMPQPQAQGPSLQPQLGAAPPNWSPLPSQMPTPGNNLNNDRGAFYGRGIT